MSDKINLLDHGFVRLVDHMGGDLAVVRAARVSYDAEPRADGSDDKLIRYLMLNRHTSPFEAVQFTFEVKAPIFVLRQWMRHRTWSYNEQSARYSQLAHEMYLPWLNVITTQHTSNKQMRTDEQHPQAEYWRDMMENQNDEAYKLYEELLAAGIPRELARTVLPLATYSHMFASVDLHNLLHFVSLRDHDHAQHEIRVYAQAIKELIRPVVPVSLAAFEEMINAR